MIRWCTVDARGDRQQGDGPVDGMNHLVRAAVAMSLQVPGMPLIVVASPDLIKWTVEGVLGTSATRRFWGLATKEDEGRMWLWPDGSMVGLGQSVEQVEAALKILQG